MPGDAIRAAILQAEPFKDEAPRPLVRELAPPTPFPVDALGDVLGAAAVGIHDKTQAAVAICGASVLAAAALVAQAHADIVLPTGQAKPLSLFLVSVAASGERKSTVDGEALWPVRTREKALRERNTLERPSYLNGKEAWDAARKRAVADRKRDMASMRAALDALGPAPPPPLDPMLTCDDPTIEGLAKLLGTGQPAVGVFTAEGGLFMGGHAMSDDARLRSAAGLSCLWDGEPLRRVRALDGASVLPGKRVSLHLMAQPEVAAGFLSDPLLADQGLLGRVLVTAPGTTAGTRLWREPSPASDAAVKRYGAILLRLAERPLPLADGKANELDPRPLRMTDEAKRVWTSFHDHVEGQTGPGCGLEAIRALANKAAEHAARIAGILALVGDPDTGEVQSEHLSGGVRLMEHFLAEALRLAGAAKLHPDLSLAVLTLEWLRTHWHDPVVSLPDLYQRGPGRIRDKATAKRVADVLEDHGWLRRIEGGAVIEGTRRREAWSVRR